MNLEFHRSVFGMFPHFCERCFPLWCDGNINTQLKGLLSGGCKDCGHCRARSLLRVVPTATAVVCPHRQGDLRFCLNVRLPGRMAEVTIGLTKVPKLGPGEMPRVGSHWHFSLLPSDTGPTFQKSIWTKRTPGDFSQQGDS